jgi:hypothetical protein
LRDENTKLRKLVADLSLDKEALPSNSGKVAGLGAGVGVPAQDSFDAVAQLV